ncbi:MAG: hypothetical protein GFH27_549309n153 [Chloroflexi bacterium AL-W]|nr:hypothetical protein [Chloroflexi bacterium AL-N1]NOK69855.1 hypothetical protein [Chloroflexi bacterium AL-N10]NOK73541.1 hypothetical protein [Chloroflexi bacterium AL-N5]NOK84025.1 hypothetical protein [Chloroflexi bacterium AL-W]NOK87872.1 hypothetical protein [Chloroflexi bacterium AL-N15]
MSFGQTDKGHLNTLGVFRITALHRLMLGMLTVIVLGGCQFFAGVDEGSIDGQPETPIAEQVQPTLTLAPDPDAVATLSPTEAETVDFQGIQRYRIDQQASSDQEALERVALIVYSAERTERNVALRVAFENTSNEAFTIIGTIRGGDALLVDQQGNEYAPTAVSEELRTRIDPSGGFGPGGANVGEITFDVVGDGPYKFLFPNYDPVPIRFDTPIDEAGFEIATGNYPIEQGLRSSEEALQNIELRLRSVGVTDDQLIFDIAFVNTGRQGYNLLVGPSGTDARLLDNESIQYEPIEVSESLADSIAPEQGWQPGEEYNGTLTFEKPAQFAEMRFLFPNYDALTVRFDENGIAEAQVTSPSGGAPLPTPTPDAEELTVAEIENVLREQAEAVQANDMNAYLNTFASELHDEQQRVLDRMSQVPLASYNLQLVPEETVNDATQTVLNQLSIEISYTLDGIGDENTFIHVLAYDFVRDGDGWRVSAVDFDDNPPFWLTGDVVVRETTHFLIFARPESAADLPTLDAEAETAYTMLRDQGLALEPRYIAYFTASRDDFETLTGQAANRLLGLALSRYEFVGNVVDVNSRAFYINGEAFIDEQTGLNAEDRQTTITHELVHLALAQDTRPFTPIWLVEGAAVYYSEDTGLDKQAELLTDRRLDTVSLMDLTTVSSLGEHDFIGEQTNTEYIFSGETFAFLLETYGESTTLDFYRSFALVPSSAIRDEMPRFGNALVIDTVFADLRQQLTDDRVQEFFNVRLEQLDTDVKTWIRENN